MYLISFPLRTPNLAYYISQRAPCVVVRVCPFKLTEIIDHLHYKCSLIVCKLKAKNVAIVS